MSDVSSRLRRARERAGLKITDISARTKIKPAFIGAIDAGKFETLPGHFFTRAFLKAYAREVGLSPDEIVRDFDLVHSAPDPVALPDLAAAVEQHPRPQMVRPVEPLRIPSAVWQAAALVAIVAGLFFLINAPRATEDSRSATVAAASGDTGVRPVGTSGESIPERLTIAINPTAQIWVAATADGATAVYKLLQPGQNVTIAGREFSFRVGNAAAFAYAINGVPGKPVGGPDEVREFQITTANYRGFLR